MATRQEIRSALDKYDAAAENRIAKRETRNQKFEAMNTATAEFETAQQEYRDAVTAEGLIEDELEAMSIEHEPEPLD